MNKYKAIVFDVGDTLVKWFPNRAELYSERLRNAGTEIDESISSMISDAVYRAEGEQIRKEENGAPRLPEDALYSMLDRAALACVPKLPEPIDALVDRLKNVPLPRQQMKVIPGVHQLLDRLQGAGYRLAIVSNHWAWLMDFLKAEGLAAYFEAIVISAVVGVKKPNVQIMEIALERLGLPGQECLYVGDQELDVLCAKQAGLDMAWIATPQAVLPDDIKFTEDYRISSVLELTDILTGNQISVATSTYE